MQRVDFLDSESLARLLELEPDENFIVPPHQGLVGDKEESGDVELHCYVVLPAHHTSARTSSFCEHLPMVNKRK
jgi:hypothetical protein